MFAMLGIGLAEIIVLGVIIVGIGLAVVMATRSVRWRDQRDDANHPRNEVERLRDEVQRLRDEVERLRDEVARLRGPGEPTEGNAIDTGIKQS